MMRGYFQHSSPSAFHPQKDDGQHQLPQHIARDALSKSERWCGLVCAYLFEKIKTEMEANIKAGFLKKLEAARKTTGIDLEISAGLYTYAVEELGKLLLLKKIKPKNGKCTINYSKEFVNHEKKFEAAFDYFEENNLEELLVINNEGSFTAKSFTWRSYNLGLMPDTQAILSVFYSDFKYSGKDRKDKDIVVEKIPNISKDMLGNNINELESIIRNNQY
jgi:hypothetical protein